MSRVNWSQDNLISIINQYLTWNNLPIKWDTRGVCRGLAIIQAQYYLEKREEEFFQIINKITHVLKNNFNQIDLTEIDHFIAQVALASSPEFFDKKLNQDNYDKYISVNGSPLNHDFNLAMVITKEEWIEVLKSEINMQEGEIFLVNNGHSITVRRSQDKYIVYDPNYTEGTKTFENEKSLLDELMKIYEQRSSNQYFGFSFQRLTSAELPNGIKRNSIPEIYERFAASSSLSRSYTSFKQNHNAVALIAEMNDEAFIDYFLEKMNPSEQQISDLRASALKWNQPQIFKKLNHSLYSKMSERSKEKEIYSQILKSVHAGSLEIFNQLKSIDEYKYYLNILAKYETMKEIIDMAALGGQPDIMLQVLADIKQKFPSTDTETQNKVNELFLNLFTNEGKYGLDVFELLILSNAHEIFTTLMRMLEVNQMGLSVERLTHYLNYAIAKNDIYIVEKLLNVLTALPEKPSLTIEIGIAQARKTHLHILLSLKEHKAQISTHVENIIKEKASHQITFWEWLGLQLQSFAEFVKGKQKRVEVQYRPGNFLQLSKELRGDVAQIDDTLTSEPLGGNKSHR